MYLGKTELDNKISLRGKKEKKKELESESMQQKPDTSSDFYSTLDFSVSKSGAYNTNNATLSAYSWVTDSGVL